VKRTIQTFEKEIANDAVLVGLDPTTLIAIQIKEDLVSEIEVAVTEREKELSDSNQELIKRKQALIDSQAPLNKKLNQPQQAFQKYIEDMKIWKEKGIGLTGSKEFPDTLLGLQHQISQLDNLPNQRASLQSQRLDLAGQIFDLLNEQREGREALFKPVQQLIQNNALIRDGYKLQFKAELGCTADFISNQLFSLVKQNSGEFRGDSESLAVIKSLTDKYDLDNKEDLLSFVVDLHDKLENSAAGDVGISSILRKDREPNEVYNLIFSQTYLKPKYTLLFQNAHIGQLSPGQRGALLLIFYLLVDKGNIPIILDQPEENLDNETIVSLLVPVLTEAKKSRQIIMVTHNPNLAVVCDAEQIVHCEFVRTDSHNISYTSGSIECKLINNKVVDVLEGTMPAFENRRVKYQ
jgi:hypothetical protein